MINVTEASAADIPVLSGLINSAYRGDSSHKGWTTEAGILEGKRIDEQALREYMEDAGATILKAVAGTGNIIGCVYLKKAPGQLYLGMLTVDPSWQARGVGKLLLQAAEERARLSGVHKIVMTVISVRTELLEWYKRHGFQETGEREHFPTDQRFGIPRMPLELLVLEKKW